MTFLLDLFEFFISSVYFTSILKLYYFQTFSIVNVNRSQEKHCY